jgi:hypothetical protein
LARSGCLFTTTMHPYTTRTILSCNVIALMKRVTRGWKVLWKSRLPTTSP